MRSVLIAGVAAAIVFAIANQALMLLSEPSDWSVTAGYLLLLSLVTGLTGLMARLWRRL